MKTLPIVLMALMMASLVAADLDYYPDRAEAISADVLTRTQQVDDEQEFLFLFSPTDSKHMTFTLSGGPSFRPRLSLWDVSEKEVIERINGDYGQTLTIEYTGAYENGQPKQYMVAVETMGNERQTFTFTYEAVHQNDLGTGMDGHYRFRNAQVLETAGQMQGFLGDEDIIDYFALELEAGEKLGFKLNPESKDFLHFTLIDGNLQTKIDQRSQLEGDALTTSYESPREQTIWIGIQGTAPYELELTRSSMPAEGADEPPMPPPLPETGNPSIDNPIVGVGVDENTGQPEPEVTTGDSNSSPVVGVVLILVVLVLIGVAVWYLKTQQSSTSEKKPAKKAGKAKK